MAYGKAGGRHTVLRVRGSATVPGDVREYTRQKVEAAAGTFGLAEVSGEVRISLAASAGADRPWAAVAEIEMPGGTVVCCARAATGHEMADLLHDRLRRLVEREVHAHNDRRRTTAAPPWRAARPAVPGPGGTGTSMT